MSESPAWSMGAVEEWRPIPGFPHYAVSDMGRVKNTATQRLMTILRNQQGTCYVGLNIGLKQSRRSLTGLVANAFVPRLRPDFSYPIHLDGDQTDNRATNLMWRPHWFGVKYMTQMKRGPSQPDAGPIVELESEERYPSPWVASMINGLIEIDLILSIENRTFVYPTFQQFRFLAL